MSTETKLEGLTGNVVAAETALILAKLELIGGVRAGLIALGADAPVCNYHEVDDKAAAFFVKLWVENGSVMHERWGSRATKLMDFSAVDLVKIARSVDAKVTEHRSEIGGNVLRKLAEIGVKPAILKELDGALGDVVFNLPDAGRCFIRLHTPNTPPSLFRSKEEEGVALERDLSDLEHHVDRLCGGVRHWKSSDEFKAESDAPSAKSAGKSQKQ